MSARTTATSSKCGHVRPAVHCQSWCNNYWTDRQCWSRCLFTSRNPTGNPLPSWASNERELYFQQFQTEMNQCKIWRQPWTHPAAPYVTLFTSGVFRDLSTAENGFYVAAVKKIIALAGPKGSPRSLSPECHPEHKRMPPIQDMVEDPQDRLHGPAASVVSDLLRCGRIQQRSSCNSSGTAWGHGTGDWPATDYLCSEITFFNYLMLSIIKIFYMMMFLN